MSSVRLRRRAVTASKRTKHPTMRVLANRRKGKTDMRREGRMLILVLSLLALPAVGVHVFAQEKPTVTESKRAPEAEQLESERTKGAAQRKARGEAERSVGRAELRKVARTIKVEQLKAKRAVGPKAPPEGTFKLLDSRLKLGKL